MPTTRYIQRLVNLEPRDFHLIRRYAQEKGLGSKGFSAALRIIVREWASLRTEATAIPLPPSSDSSGHPES